MLRYRTRDITRLTTRACACGRTHLRLLRVSGRSDDMLIVRGVNVFPSQIEAVLVGRSHLAPHYQLVIDRRGSLDHVALEVEASTDLTSDQYTALSRDVAHHVKSLIGISVDVTVLKPGAVPRSQGKAVRVRDLRPKGD
jgi:phenylacetate-CoA ligase